MFVKVLVFSWCLNLCNDKQQNATAYNLDSWDKKVDLYEQLTGRRSFQGRDIHRRPASNGARDGTINHPTAPTLEITTFSNTLYQQATCLYSHRHSLSGEIP